MTKKEKDRWVKALISGRYKQGNGVLYDSARKSYCCLGVECVVNRRVKKHAKMVLDGIGLPNQLFNDDAENYLRSDDEEWIPSMVADKLADVNDYKVDLTGEPNNYDGEQVPFELIAGLCLVPWDGKTV